MIQTLAQTDLLQFATVTLMTRAGQSRDDLVIYINT